MKIVDVKTHVMGSLEVKLDEAVVAEHPREHIFFNLFAENWHRRQAIQPPPASPAPLRHVLTVYVGAGLVPALALAGLVLALPWLVPALTPR